MKVYNNKIKIFLSYNIKTIHRKDFYYFLESSHTIYKNKQTKCYYGNLKKYLSKL